MKIATITTATALVFALFANAETNDVRRLDAAQRRARREARIAADGGLVQKPSHGKVVRVALNTDAVREADFSSVFDEIRRFLSISVEPIGASEATRNPTGAIVAIIDEPGQPTLLIAPEDGWATLNIAPLKADNPSEQLLHNRLHKEFWRAFAYVMGAANPQQQPCLMRPIRSIEDLDSHKVAVLSPGPMGNVAAFATTTGFARTEYATYKKACLEGWAPAPTNDIQRVVWEQVKAEQSEKPTNPMRILPGQKPSGK